MSERELIGLRMGIGVGVVVRGAGGVRKSRAKDTLAPARARGSSLLSFARVRGCLQTHVKGADADSCEVREEV